MKLTKNVTEPTTIELNTNIKSDFEQLCGYVNRPMNEMVGIALIQFIKENGEYFVENMIVEAFDDLLKMEVGDTCFCCPALNVTGYLIGEYEFKIDVEVLDGKYNKKENFDRIITSCEELKEYLVFLFDNYIGFDTDYTQKYIEERLKYGIFVEEVM